MCGVDHGQSASESERLREWARLGYQRALEEELDRRRLETYDEWSDDPEMGVVAEAMFTAAIDSGLFQDE